MKKNICFTILIFVFAIAFKCEGRIIFLHIPKTAGTTLHSLMLDHFNGADIYPFAKINKNRVNTFSLLDVQNVFYEFPMITQKYVHGHFPIWFLKEKDPNFAKSYIFTVLRDPVDRVLSHWAYLGANGSPTDIWPNMMCKMLCSDVTLTDEELLQDSINNLNRMDYILFQDDFDNGVKRLFSHVGINKPDFIPQKNQSERKEVSEEIIAEIKELNDLDIRLYKYANKYSRKKFK